MNSTQKGKLGEDIACQYLMTSYYHILQRNFKSSFGEIDIIALYNQCLVFIEVKSRSSTRFGQAKEAVNLQKQERIRKVATYFLYKNPFLRFHSIRFDVIEVYPSPHFRLHHLKNAF